MENQIGVEIVPSSLNVMPISSMEPEEYNAMEEKEEEEKKEKEEKEEEEKKEEEEEEEEEMPSGVTPFLRQLYRMVQNSKTNDIISWKRSGKRFVIWDKVKFETILLPPYYKHNNISNFIRQLSSYGFRKTDSDPIEYENSEFQRGEKHLLKTIQRGKKKKKKSTARR